VSKLNWKLLIKRRAGLRRVVAGQACLNPIALLATSKRRDVTSAT
jgi:hypothetical protein